MHKTEKQILSMRSAAIVVAMACALTASAQTAPDMPAPPATPSQPPAEPAAAPAAPADAPKPAPADAPKPTPADAQTSAPAAAASQVAPVALIPLTTNVPLTPEAAAVKKRLEEKFPAAQIKNVSKSGILGFYEAQFDGQMVYTDANAKYVLVGSIFDAETKKNLTEERSRKLNRIAVDALPFDLSFKKVKGNGTRKLILFSDADCPFCARLEKTLRDVDDVTIYTFLFPIDSLHPDAARKSKMIWCSPDRVKAWDEFFSTGKLPDNNGDCDTPVARTQALGQQLHFNATPTIVFADGTIVPGALPKDRLEAEMAQADVEAKKLAAAKMKPIAQ